MSEENYGSTVSFIKGLVFGGLIGAGLALLYAPKSGKELRKDIKNKTAELKTDAEKLYEEAKEYAGDFIVDSLKKAENLKKEAEEKFEVAKKKFEAMLSESKRLAEDAKEMAEQKIAEAQDKIEAGKKVVSDKASKIRQAIEGSKEAFHKEKSTSKA